VQHKVGMQTSKVIVAINKNPDSPIFEFADLGLVGDMFDIDHKLTEEVRKRKQG
jgi:electron transfer flavoprotein alpha subunit